MAASMMSSSPPPDPRDRRRAARGPLAAASLVALLGLDPSPALPSPDAAAPRAEYATAAELEPEGPAHVLDVAVLAQAVAASEPEQAGGVAGVASLALGGRLLLGRGAGYCLGLDGELGGSDEGLRYGATGYAAGLGARWGEAGRIALCGGAGLDGVTGAVPLAARFPVELSLALDAGPLRLSPWARAAWTAGDEARQDGVSWLSAVDEVEAGLLVRFARQRRYWSTASSGGGFAAGLVYRELMDTRWFGLVLGLELTGAQ
jgi:hypothetical protein